MSTFNATDLNQFTLQIRKSVPMAKRLIKSEMLRDGLGASDL